MGFLSLGAWRRPACMHLRAAQLQLGARPEWRARRRLACRHSSPHIHTCMHANACTPPPTHIHTHTHTRPPTRPAVADYVADLCVFTEKHCLLSVAGDGTLAVTDLRKNAVRGRRLVCLGRRRRDGLVGALPSAPHGRQRSPPLRARPGGVPMISARALVGVGLSVRQALCC